MIWKGNLGEFESEKGSFLRPNNCYLFVKSNPKRNNFTLIKQKKKKKKRTVTSERDNEVREGPLNNETAASATSGCARHKAPNPHIHYAWWLIIRDDDVNSSMSMTCHDDDYHDNISHVDIESSASPPPT